MPWSLVLLLALVLAGCASDRSETDHSSKPHGVGLQRGTSILQLPAASIQEHLLALPGTWEGRLAAIAAISTASFTDPSDGTRSRTAASGSSIAWLGTCSVVWTTLIEEREWDGGSDFALCYRLDVRSEDEAVLAHGVFGGSVARAFELGRSATPLALGLRAIELVGRESDVRLRLYYSDAGETLRRSVHFELCRSSSTVCDVRLLGSTDQARAE